MSGAFRCVVIDERRQGSFGFSHSLPASWLAAQLLRVLVRVWSGRWPRWTDSELVIRLTEPKSLAEPERTRGAIGPRLVTPNSPGGAA